jgi:hypothetical protein
VASLPLIIATSGPSLLEHSLVTADQLDDVGLALVGDVLRSEPQDLPLQRSGHERADGPSAAEVLVRLGPEIVDPIGDALKRHEIAVSCPVLLTSWRSPRRNRFMVIDDMTPSPEESARRSSLPGPPHTRGESARVAEVQVA